MTSPPKAPAGEIIIHVFGRTDVGRTREHNEDAFVVADLTTDNATLQPEVRTHTGGAKGTLFMVADGMGGAAAGEIASAMAVDIVLGELRTSWITQDADSAEAFVRAIKQATKAANEQINTFAATHPEYRGMGTTATIAGLLGDTLYLAQVGDSRAYIVRNKVVRQITKDQSLMQKLIEAGELTEEEAEHSERRNIILQALGPEPTVKVDLTYQTVRRGDTLILCSDGLSGQVTRDDIAEVAGGETDLMAACKALIDRANGNGGPDNITVIVARFDGPGLKDPEAEDEIGHQVFQLPETGQTPSMSFDRIIERTSTTKPAFPAPVTDSRPTEKTARIVDDGRPSAASPAPAPELVRGPTRSVAPLDVSPARRSAGRVIAYVLLGLLVVAAGWFAVQRFGGSSAAASTSTPH